MYKTINGWTKEKMIAQIQMRNNGTVSVRGGRCQYRANHKPNGNACAVGCFIPDEDYQKRFEEQPLWFIIDQIPGKMPLEISGLHSMLGVHDRSLNKDPRIKLIDWINANVED